LILNQNLLNMLKSTPNYFIILCCFFNQFLFSQSYNITDQVCIGGDQMEGAAKTIKLSNGNIVICGFSKSGASGVKNTPNYGMTDIWAVCIDESMSILWEVNLGGSQNEMVNDIIETSDHSLILVGDSKSMPQGTKTAPNFGNEDVWVIKLDLDGNIVWDRSYGGTSSESGYSIVEVSSNSYIIGGDSSSDIGGNKTSPNLGGSDCFLIKINGNGDLIWDKSIGGSDVDFNREMIKINDNSYLLGSSSQSNSSIYKSQDSYGETDYWPVIIDSNGNVINETTIGGNASDVIWGLITTVNGEILIAGNSFSDISGLKTEDTFGNGDDDIWIVKLDASLNLINQKTIGSTKTDEITNIVAINNTEFLVMGSSNSGINEYKSETNKDTYSDFWFFTMDENLNVKSDKTIGAINTWSYVTEYMVGFHKISANDYLIIGTSGNGISGDKTCTGNGSYDFWVLKVQSDLAVEQLESNNELQLFPNPVTNVLHVASLNKEINTLAVFDALGKVIYTSTSSLSQKDINLSDTESGFYYLQVTFEDGTSISMKFVKE
jgi:hypothetical protein